MTCKVARAAAVATGFPPKVVPCWPGVSSAVASVPKTIIAPMGNPPPRPLARVMASGMTPAEANQAPVRPMPVWTSSKISSAPAAAVISRAACR